MVFSKNKKSQYIQETGKYNSLKGKAKPIETVSEKDQRADLLGQEFKNRYLKDDQRIKEDVRKSKKMMHEQNGNTDKELKTWQEHCPKF